MAESQTILVDVSVEVDDEAVLLEGNTLTFTEGLGESTTKGATQGGRTVVVHSQDVTTRISTIKFEMPATVDSLNTSRDWATLGAGRVVRFSGTDPAGNRLGRTMTGGIMSTDPEKAIQSEGKVPVEFAGAPLAVS